ncbi:MAG: hypothetical protein P4L53_20760 [Candidatus Obscuribacterales bacterium]|nr:hypothetical protein [Candidatus Obscuribacterales bacterium]
MKLKTECWQLGFLCGLVFSASSLSVGAEEKEHLKVIAPDLIVESFEGGKFPKHHAPSDKPKKVIFIPTKESKDPGFTYGYRIKLKTTRKEVNVKEQFEAFPAKSVGRMEKPIDGCIYRDWEDEALTVPNYWVKVWLEDVELPTLHVSRK